MNWKIVWVWFLAVVLLVLIGFRLVSAYYSACSYDDCDLLVKTDSVYSACSYDSCDLVVRLDSVVSENCTVTTDTTITGTLDCTNLSISNGAVLRNYGGTVTYDNLHLSNGSLATTNGGVTY